MGDCHSYSDCARPAWGEVRDGPGSQMPPDKLLELAPAQSCWNLLQAWASAHSLRPESLRRHARSRFNTSLCISLNRLHFTFQTAQPNALAA